MAAGQLLHWAAISAICLLQHRPKHIRAVHDVQVEAETIPAKSYSDLQPSNKPVMYGVVNVKSDDLRGYTRAHRDL